MIDRNDQRVLSRQGARELVEEEIGKVTGGTSVVTGGVPPITDVDKPGLS